MLCAPSIPLCQVRNERTSPQGRSGAVRAVDLRHPLALTSLYPRPTRSASPPAHRSLSSWAARSCASPVARMARCTWWSGAAGYAWKPRGCCGRCGSPGRCGAKEEIRRGGGGGEERGGLHGRGTWGPGEGPGGGVSVWTWELEGVYAVGSGSEGQLVGGTRRGGWAGTGRGVRAKGGSRNRELGRWSRRSRPRRVGRQAWGGGLGVWGLPG